MSILDAEIVRSNPVIDWTSQHGAAMTLLACVCFWALVGVSIYLGFQYF